MRILKPNVIYLHGFASSPESRKAQYFKQRMAEHGITLQIPDLNVPSFERLTLTAMLEKIAQTVRLCPPGPVYLIGSSMGGLAALHFINQYKDAEARRTELAVFLAPAFDFADNRQNTLGEKGLADWEATGWLDVHNYAADDMRRVHYGLYEDVTRYDSYAVSLLIPALVFHGVHDDVVPVNQSEVFAAERNNVTLHTLDSDHTLLNQLDIIWDATRKFFVL
ncbi:MAG: YqiA/YcfP family alpha/beta fold hydrolase [Chloroflexota bacterium]